MMENKYALQKRINYLENFVLDFFNQKINKYEQKMYEWCYKEGSNKVWEQYQKLWNNTKIWRKGMYYIWLKNEILDLNYDFETGEYLLFENFSLHHEPYVWEHLLTKGIYPINKNNHKKGKMINNGFI